MIRVKYYIKEYKTIFTALFILYSLIEIIHIILPMYSAKLIDDLVSKNFSSGYKIVVVIILLTVFTTIINYIYSIYKEKEINNLAYKIEKDAYNSVYMSNYFFIKKEDKVLISQKILKDSNNIATFILNNIFSVILNGVIVVIIFCILYSKHITFFMISLGTLPIYVLFIYYIRNVIHKVMYEAREKRDIYSSAYVENTNNIYGVKAFSIIEKVQERLEVLYKKKLKIILKEYKIFYIFYSVEGIFTLIVQTIFFSLGIKYIQDGSLSIGDFTVILTYYQMIIKNFNYYLILGKDYEDYNISLKRLNEIEKKEKDKVGDLKYSRINKLELKDYSFEMEKGKNINYNKFILRKGDILKIEGENGTGKTTLLNIILGIYPSNEKVFINNTEISKLDMNFIRKNSIAYLNQNFKFIEGCGLENINFYSEKNYTVEDIEKEMTRLDICFNMLKLSSILNKKVNNLSEGEKQIIALTTIFLKDVDLIILDEPLKGLDYKNRDIVIQYIDKLRKDRIIILIEHSDLFNINCNKLFLKIKN